MSLGWYLSALMFGVGGFLIGLFTAPFILDWVTEKRPGEPDDLVITFKNRKKKP